MHAPLGTPERQLVCSDLIAALEECHSRGLFHKLSGACNSHKMELNMCLRKERIERTARNREDSKVRNEKKAAAWKEYESDMKTPISATTAPAGNSQ